MSTITIEHLARVEGHGGITVELQGDAVEEVRFDVFEGPRLIEPLLKGRRYDEVAPIVSRICSICSAAHTVTSLKATESAFGIRVSPQTELLRELLFRGESIESHALHIFLLAVPDYLNYPSAIALAADKPAAVLLGLRLKKLGNTMQETVGGRAVHPVNPVLGGFGKAPSLDQLIALRTGLLQAAADSDAVIDLMAGLPAADFCRSETSYAALRSPNLDSYYAGDEVMVASSGNRAIVPAADYRSLTNEETVAHSHAKHSTFRGSPFMVGSLARLTVNPRRLTGKLAVAMKRLKLSLPADNPMDNNKAQAIELVNDVERSLEIIEQLLREGVKDERAMPVNPRAGQGVAITEAPRGLLIHSYKYDAEGRIEAADIITPTALNAASMEQHFRRAVEQSAERDEAALTRRLQMIARAYDPCISCSVHLVRHR
ncbi:MAG TPA: Ni/Fe hydrogenase subunit alpha [Bryobacteraceae bacterium]|nr:Ni/Fe hydrogenase subunit alpha [Bryobacteraceae bacterium]